MLKWLVLAVGLMTGTANAAEVPEVASALQDPIKDMKNQMEEKKSEEELAQQRRLEALEASQKKFTARVVVLEWPESDTNYKDETLIRNVSTRIARPDAKFFPEIDLYQAGRKEPDKTVLPVYQRGVVPDDAAERVQQVVDEVSTIAWDAISEQDWGLRAVQMRELAEEIWFVDRPELREPMFKLYAQIGRAAENRNDYSPPFFEQVGGLSVNYYWYLAGAMAYRDPGLLSKIESDQELTGAIKRFKDMLDDGTIPLLELSFDLEGKFDAEGFTKEYMLFINGLEDQITDPKGLYRVPPGRIDVYLKRDDGHSLSDRIEIDKLDEKVYFVRDTARQKMGKYFIDQLMLHPNECTPAVDGDILNYLAIYQRLHPEAEIYIAVPYVGSPHKVYLWRWKRELGNLERVQDDRGFIITFAALMGTGMNFGGLDVGSVDPESLVPQPGDTTAPALNPADLITPAPNAVPIKYQMRMHWGRLMIPVGVNFSASLSGGWSEMFQTKSAKGDDVDEDGNPVLRYLGDGNPVIGAADPEADPELIGCDADGDGQIDAGREDVCVYGDEPPAMNTPTFQRLIYTGVGVMLLRDAAFGFGPRAYFRVGWYNAPHALDLTGHLGITATGPVKDDSVKTSRRVFPIGDFDVYAGTMVPFRDSVTILFETNGKGDPKKLGKAIPTFGFTLSGGITF